MSKVPSKETKDFWIRVDRQGKPRKVVGKSGKWMIFVHEDHIDDAWERIEYHTRRGNLGCSAKVATMRPNPNAQRADVKLICVYAEDSEDAWELLRILAWLRRLGFDGRLNYKEDKETLAGNYAHNTNGPVSLYTSAPGTISMNHPGKKELIDTWECEKVPCTSCYTNQITIPTAQQKGHLTDPLYDTEGVVCLECNFFDRSTPDSVEDEYMEKLFEDKMNSDD